MLQRNLEVGSASRELFSPPGRTEATAPALSIGHRAVVGFPRQRLAMCANSARVDVSNHRRKLRTQLQVLEGARVLPVSGSRLRPHKTELVWGHQHRVLS